MSTRRRRRRPPVKEALTNKLVSLWDEGMRAMRPARATQRASTTNHEFKPALSGWHESKAIC